MVELDPLIRAFYRDRYVEADRLARSGHGRLEFLRTQEPLRRWLGWWLPLASIGTPACSSGAAAAGSPKPSSPRLVAASFHFLARGTVSGR